MNIACLAWGSLVWDPRDLPIHRYWFDDGPLAPVEFTRLSNDGRITLVLDEAARPVRLLWAQMTLSEFDEAKEALKRREGITAEDWKSRIGGWQTGDPAPSVIPSLPVWAEGHGLDAAIWTALGPRHRRKGEPEPRDERPTIDWVVGYIRSLTGPTRKMVERYVRRAPPQIDTEYRRRLEAEFGWAYRRN